MDNSNVKEIAIEFAKYLMERTVRKHTSFVEFIDYVPNEYKLLNGELILSGSELYDEFINTMIQKELFTTSKSANNN